MNHVIGCFFFCVLSSAFFCQKNGSNLHLNPGEIIHETLKLTDSSGNSVSIKAPAQNCILLYRMRGQNWLLDNNDSVAFVEQIVKQLLATSNTFKGLRVVCYSHNHDNYLSLGNKAVFKESGSYTIENYFLTEKNTAKLLNAEKLLLINKRGKVLFNCSSIGGCDYRHKDEQRTLKGKLLTEKNGVKIPVTNARVFLKNNSTKDTVLMTETNKYGDFEINIPDDSQQHTLRVEPAQTEIETIILASQDGVERARLYKNGDGFEYKIIEADIVRLSDMNVDEDIGIALANFLKTKEKEFKKSEFINYPVGSYKIEEDSKHILDKIALFLSETPNVRLEVISHTDAQGDDKSNLDLSEKRSLSVVSYLILIGLHKDRLTYTGKGETEIRNRCINGVDCSDLEHRFNRRTEFRFIKE